MHRVVPCGIEPGTTTAFNADLDWYSKLKRAVAQGQFEVYTPVLVFMAVWFFDVSSFLLPGIGFLFRGYLHHQAFSKDDLFTLIPFAMLLFGIALMRSVIWLGQRGEPKVLMFLEKLLATGHRGKQGLGKFAPS